MSRPKKRRGADLGNHPPDGDPWTWMTAAMQRLPTFQALSISARRTLDFLLIEHCAHGGQENGRLAAPYRQLERFGVTKADIAKSLAELELTGWVRCTEQGLRQAGGGEPSRYALTWLPTGMWKPPHEREPATHDWKRVMARLTAEGITSARQVRAWLKQKLMERGRVRGRHRLARWKKED